VDVDLVLDPHVEVDGDVDVDPVVDLDLDPRQESSTRVLRETPHRSTYKVEDGVDVYVAVQVNVRDYVDVNVNLDDARPA
jgi:hypothetical protein